MATIFIRLHEALSRSRDRKIYKCERTNTTSQRLCNATFSRASSLKRHEMRYHQDVESTTFVFYISGSRSRRSVYSTSKSIISNATASARHSASRRASRISILATCPSSSRAVQFLAPCSTPLEMPLARSQQNLSEASTPLSLTSSTSLQEALLSTITPPTSASQIRSRLPELLERSDDTLDSNYNARALNHQNNSHGNNGTAYSVAHISQGSTNASQTMSSPNDRPLEFLNGMMPSYEIRLSRRTLDQSKGLDWLTQTTKKKFDNTYETLLTRWGVTSRHTRICVLVSEDWRFSNSLDLMTLFSIDNVPSASSSRAWYSYADHETSLIRAKVWYAKSSRTDLDLDVFLGCGPYKSMNASHLCHHEHCIVHITYESADVNQDRQQCCRRAHFLREEKRPVSDQCTIHSPPCMMQVNLYWNFQCFSYQIC